MDTFISVWKFIWEHITPYIDTIKGFVLLVLGWFLKDIYNGLKERRAKRRKQRLDRIERERVVSITEEQYQRLIKFEEDYNGKSPYPKFNYHFSLSKSEKRVVSNGRIMLYEKVTGQSLRYNSNN